MTECDGRGRGGQKNREKCGRCLWTAPNLKPLNTTIRRSWRKIDSKKEHTLTKLKRIRILSLEDELAKQEGKIVWKWSKQKLPKGNNYLNSGKD